MIIPHNPDDYVSESSKTGDEDKMKETIAVGTKCPLCDGTFYMPEPKYSKMITRLLAVARAAADAFPDLRTWIDNELQGTKMYDEVDEMMRGWEAALTAAEDLL